MCVYILCKQFHAVKFCFPTYTGIPDVPRIVPDVTIDSNTISVNRTNVTLTLSWGESFNNFDPIVNYTVSCSGDVSCPPNFTTTDNTTRSYTITNLTTMTNYTFSVVATNSIGSGEAGVVIITTPPGESTDLYMFMHKIYIYCIAGYFRRVFIFRYFEKTFFCKN